MATAKSPCPFPHNIYDGITVPPFVTPQKIQEIEKRYVPRDGDVFIATYPKSGTTWLSHILNQVLGEPQGPQTRITGAVPWLQDCDLSQVENMASPRILKTHDLWRWCKKSEKIKYIFCYRNPKDVCCSYYHHIQYFSADYQYPVSFEQYFREVFMIPGAAEYGSYFDYHVHWFSQLRNPVIHFVSYEELVEDLPRAVERIAEFLGVEVSRKRVEEIAAKSTFAAMSKSTFCNYSWDRGAAGGKGKFLRKGKVGGWMDEMTEEQSGMVEKMAKEMIEDRFAIKFRYVL